MEKNKQTTLYNERRWLNESATSSSGSVVCYNGVCFEENEKEPYELLFCEIADCHVKARLHKTIFESREQFIVKMELLRDSIDSFINHLKKQDNGKEIQGI